MTGRKRRNEQLDGIPQTEKSYPCEKPMTSGCCFWMFRGSGQAILVVWSVDIHFLGRYNISPSLQTILSVEGHFRGSTSSKVHVEFRQLQFTTKVISFGTLFSGSGRTFLKPVSWAQKVAVHHLQTSSNFSKRSFLSS